MRTFWILLLIAAAAGAVYLLLPTPTPRGNQPAGLSPSQPNVTTAPTEQAPSLAPQSSPTDSAKSTTPNPVAPTSSVQSPVTQPIELPKQPEAPSQTAATKVNITTPDQPATQENKVGANTNPDNKQTQTAVSTTESSVFPVLSDIGGYKVLPANIENKPDGSMLADSKFLIRGDGSIEKPYEVTWELLTSVDAEFDPQAGKKQLPYRIAMLHDKYVKLGGFIAFPMNMQQPKELLLMLNQWDGCCIGVPPTPYDAIEVTLDKIVEGEDRFSTTGGVVGKFQVKPYVVGDWLVGLYVMDRGSLKPGFGGGSGS